MTLAASLALLLSASDIFPVDWTAAAHGWGPGLRGMPSAISVDADGLHFRTRETGADPYPWVEDMVRTLPRKLTRAEQPFLQLWINLPPLNEWPTQPNGSGNYTYFAWRVSAHVANVQNAYYWPGFFLGRGPDGTPWFGNRILVGVDWIRPIPVAGPWTLGMRFDAEGVLSFYAHPGYVELTEADFLKRDEGDWQQHMTYVSQHFLQLGVELGNTAISTDWIIRRLTARATMPKLTIAPGPTLTTSGIYPGCAFTLLRSPDLSAWQPVATFASDGSYSDQPSPAAFYQLTQ